MSVEQEKILVRGATIVSMDASVGDLERGDIRIEGGVISAVGPDVDAANVDRVIDANGCIVIPGFIDTHRHMWEAILRGFAPHYTLNDYFGTLLLKIAPALTPGDVYLGNRLSAAASLEAGVTTVQDISNIQDTPEHTDAAVQALRDSGLRAVFAYGKSFAQMMSEGSRLPDDTRRVRSELLADDTALVTMALDTESGDDAAELHNYRLAGELGVRTARHVSSEYPVARLQQLQAVARGTTFIHGNDLDPNDLRIIADSDGGLSVAPAIELMMGHGYPYIQPAEQAGLRISLSVDVEVVASVDMFTQMRAAYQAARYRQFATSDGSPSVSVQQILRYATIAGAETLGLAERTGSISPGKQADLVILRGDRPDVVPVIDPYSTVVLQMDRSHIDTVMIAGKIAKHAGRLTDSTSHLIAEANEAAKRLLSIS